MPVFIPFKVVSKGNLKDKNWKTYTFPASSLNQKKHDPYQKNYKKVASSNKMNSPFTSQAENSGTFEDHFLIESINNLQNPDKKLQALKIKKLLYQKEGILKSLFLFKISALSSLISFYSKTLLDLFKVSVLLDLIPSYSRTPIFADLSLFLDLFPLTSSRILPYIETKNFRMGWSKGQRKTLQERSSGTQEQRRSGFPRTFQVDDRHPGRARLIDRNAMGNIRVIEGRIVYVPADDIRVKSGLVYNRLRREYFFNFSGTDLSRSNVRQSNKTRDSRPSKISGPQKLKVQAKTRGVVAPVNTASPFNFSRTNISRSNDRQSNRTRTKNGGSSTGSNSKNSQDQRSSTQTNTSDSGTQETLGMTFPKNTPGSQDQRSSTQTDISVPGDQGGTKEQTEIEDPQLETRGNTSALPTNVVEVGGEGSGCFMIEKKEVKDNEKEVKNTEADFCFECIKKDRNKSVLSSLIGEEGFLKSTIDYLKKVTSKTRKKVQAQTVIQGDAVTKICSPEKSLKAIIKNFNRTCPSPLAGKF